MKVCLKCGSEIHTKDGDNVCIKCYYQISDAKKLSKKIRENRRAREQLLKDLGMHKVKGALGGTYWE